MDIYLSGMYDARNSITQRYGGKPNEPGSKERQR